MSWFEKKLFQYILNKVFYETRCTSVPFYSRSKLRGIFEMLFNHLYTVYYKAGNDKVNEFLIEIFKDVLVPEVDRTSECVSMYHLLGGNSKEESEEDPEKEEEEEDPKDIGEPISHILKLLEVQPDRFNVYEFGNENNPSPNTTSLYDVDLDEFYVFNIVGGCESHDWMTDVEGLALYHTIRKLLWREQENLKNEARAELCKRYKL